MSSYKLQGDIKEAQSDIKEFRKDVAHLVYFISGGVMLKEAFNFAWNEYNYIRSARERLASK